MKILLIIFTIVVFSPFYVSAQESESDVDMPWLSEKPVAIAVEKEIEAKKVEAEEKAEKISEATIIDTISFEKDNIDISPDELEKIEKLSKKMREDDSIRIMLNSYASIDKNSPKASARRISLKRALAIRKLIIGDDSKVEKTRINIRAFGNKLNDNNADKIEIEKI